VVVHIFLVVDGEWGVLVIRFGSRGSIVFCIEKPRILVTTLLSSELDVCHPHGLV
jgi:hypothetical protein